MTISSSTQRNDYIGAGSAGPFAFGYRIFAATDLTVLRRSAAGLETALHYPLDFTISAGGVGNRNGGSITLTTALAIGETLTVSRVLPITQSTDLRNLGSYLPENIEDQLDRLVMIDQQHDDAIGRSLKLARSLNPVNYNLELPVPEAGKAIVGTGTGFTMALLDGGAVALPGNGRTVTTLSAYLANNAVFNPKDFGPLGTADDTATFALTIAAAGSQRIVLPDGTFILKNLGIPGGTRMFANPGTVTLKLKTLAALDGSPILNVTGSDVVISGVGFDGNKAAQPADGFADSFDTGPSSTGRAYRAAIRFKDPTYTLSGLTVDRCSFVNTYGACVATNGVSKVTVTSCVADNCNFETVFIYNFGGAVPTKGHRVIGNRSTNIGSGHATVNADVYIASFAEDFVFSNNLADTFERCLIKIEKGNRFTLSGNVGQHNSLNFEGIQLQSPSTDGTVIGNTVYDCALGITMNGDMTNVSIIGNIINLNGVSRGTPDGISFGAGVGNVVTIEGNTITGVVRNCIGVQPSGALRGLTVKGNTCRTTGTVAGCGIFLAANGAWRDILVDANNVDCGNVVLNGAGIYVTSNGGNTMALVKITNNIVDVGTGHKGIYEAVAGTIISGIVDDNLVDGFIQIQATSTCRIGDNNQVIPGNGNTISGPGFQRVATVTPVAVTADDRFVMINLAAAGPSVVNLPQFPQIGRRLTIKDAKGDAATNNIVVTPYAAGGHTLDFNASYAITGDRAALEIEYLGGGAWRSIGNFRRTATAVADVAALVSVEVPAGAYGANEQTLLTHIKTDLAAIRAQVNALLAARRAVGEQA